MNYILFDGEERNHLLPFTFTRPVSEIRTGISTISEKWEHALNQKVSFFTEKYLSEKYPLVVSDYNILINGAVIPNKQLTDAIQHLNTGQQLLKEGKLLAVCLNASQVKAINKISVSKDLKGVEYTGPLVSIEHIWDIFRFNDQLIRQDFFTQTRDRKSAVPDSTNQVINPDGIFLEAGARVSCSVINASTGPVYIGKDAEIMEGCLIRGPFALGEQAVLKMGAKVYGATTIGPYSKVGGEVSNSVIFGCSNKAHDGFLGNSVLGEWCNLGADTNNSNLKNNYGPVRVWSYQSQSFVNSNLQFCGLFMGDHSKCGINTMFNTGTVTGVCSNIFGAGFPPKFIPSFSWGGPQQSEVFRLDKAIELAGQVFKRRGMDFTHTETEILTYLFENKSDLNVPDQKKR